MLLLCTSIPAITFFIGRLSVVVLLFFFTYERQLLYREAADSPANALNVYQSYNYDTLDLAWAGYGGSFNALASFLCNPCSLRAGRRRIRLTACATRV